MIACDKTIIEIPKKGIYFFQEKEAEELWGSIDKYNPEAAYSYIMNTEWFDSMMKNH